MEGEKTQSVPYYQQPPPPTGAALEVMHDGEEKRLFDERSTHKKVQIVISRTCPIHLLARKIQRQQRKCL